MEATLLVKGISNMLVLRLLHYSITLISNISLIIYSSSTTVWHQTTDRRLCIHNLLFRSLAITHRRLMVVMCNCRIRMATRRISILSNFNDLDLCDLTIRIRVYCRECQLAVTLIPLSHLVRNIYKSNNNSNKRHGGLHRLILSRRLSSGLEHNLLDRLKGRR